MFLKLLYFVKALKNYNFLSSYGNWNFCDGHQSREYENEVEKCGARGH